MLSTSKILGPSAKMRLKDPLGSGLGLLHQNSPSKRRIIPHHSEKAVSVNAKASLLSHQAAAVQPHGPASELRRGGGHAIPLETSSLIQSKVISGTSGPGTLDSLSVNN